MGSKKRKFPMVQIISDYESGMNSVKLGEKYGSTPSTILKRLRENGVEVRSRILDLPIDQIISDYESGVGCYQLGEKYGCSHETILSRLKKNGVVVRPRGLHLKKSYPMVQIISDYEGGMSCVKLAEKYGCSYQTISNRLRAEGIEIRRGGKEADLPISQIISDYESGMSCGRLGKKYGCTAMTIWRKLKGDGVKIRNSGRNKIKI